MTSMTADPNQCAPQNGHEELSSIEDRLKDLRSRISEDAQAIDTYKAKTAAAMGGGVFLFLLAAVPAYDLLTGNTSLWFMLDITRDQLYWIAGALSLTSLLLLAMAAMRERQRDRAREIRLDELEEEFARLLERKEAISQAER
ncbi:MAG: hypothetical protein L0229_10410 [Blastocatellia bacterium]|nr:hypothetical protein [Blastocatellia bacterium]